MAAEYVATMYVLFLFIFFPVLNLGTVCLRAFFLWFACNQSVMLAAKAKTFNTLIRVPDTATGTPYPGAYATAQQRAAQIRDMFPGVNFPMSATNPQVDIVVTPIPNVVPSPGPGFRVIGPATLASVSHVPDVDSFVYSIRVTIRGSVDPLIPVPWFNIEGLSAPMNMNVACQAQFENPPGLQF
ncbi:MAG TPA: hypothetical protein PKN86_07685 [Candidatus Obscuribacter sp.]|nr:hypothetical protein [Candidatus Obscuribacter sp.]HNM49566.1 hypothetical protein [Candidatus Obscuribacter sp.]